MPVILCQHFKLPDLRQNLEWTSSHLSNRIISMNPSNLPSVILCQQKSLEWTSSHLFKRILSMEPSIQSKLSPLSRFLRKHAPEIPPAYNNLTRITLINHVRILDVTLNSSNAPQTSPPAADHPQPTDNHAIPLFTMAFQLDIQEKDIEKLKSLHCLFYLTMKTDFYLFPL